MSQLKLYKIITTSREGYGFNQRYYASYLHKTKLLEELKKTLIEGFAIWIIEVDALGAECE